ncbi:hypothetical protein [Clostridioides difficile]|uniref:hypothetical protein n=1 Tax=Clostridioides difficile TaxID=1496 RepID=UPI00038D0534|nr:hypothetical protein [Clostridioides difficile]EGT4674131.1 hypothetical protein [Clostridioides difficile]EGT5508091.1 hypothetical protein [Clostridioides difficile]EGT5540646.1 hypothetical protein [Clostridioides difficile]EGT5549946.1 hypothetical protein [Clostridioides difficile]EGT5553636.1 hypothetical protein [Clostridioides difficile]
MSIEIKSDVLSTVRALEFFDNYKIGFGTVVEAKMESKPEKAEYKLTLINNRGENMIIKNCCSAGYNGEGCRGTLKILTDCGFDVTTDFIRKNVEFDLKK